MGLDTAALQRHWVGLRATDRALIETAPIVETARLRLRAHGREDLADCLAMWGDPIVTRYIGGKPSTRQQTWMRMLAYAGHWGLMGFGYWAIEERQTGAFVGEIGFADFKRELEPSIEGKPELGWALTPSMHRKGYATEAIQAACAWGDEHFEQKQTVCIIDPENLISIRVAEKAGFSESARILYHGEPVVLFSRHVVEWKDR
ncbi:MAG: GNAT family N-acetyltransferase [Vulcanimicrobiaceae bacterium]